MSDDDRPAIGHVLHRLEVAGAEVLAADLSRRLADRYRFVFLCLDGIGPLGQQLADEGFEVVDLQRTPGIDLAVARRLHRVVQRHHLDLLHAHQYTPFFYAALSRRAGLGDSPAIIFTEHGRHYPDTRRLRRLLANRVLLKPRDHVTAVGAFVRQALIDFEGLPPTRIEVIHNGIDPETFAYRGGGVRFRGRSPSADPDSDEPGPGAEVTPAEVMPAEAGSAGLTVLQIARFHKVKDHPTAIRAFGRVAEQVPDARLVLVGDGALRPAMEALVDELGLTRHVRFLGVRRDIPALLAAADVFLLSSLSEGISVTLLEAMAAGLPIAATQVGGNPEVVDHGRNGLLSPRGDDAALARNLVMLLRDPAMRARMGDAGRNRLLKYFTQKQMHDAYTRLYQQMLSDTPGR